MPVGGALAAVALGPGFGSGAPPSPAHPAHAPIASQTPHFQAPAALLALRMFVNARVPAFDHSAQAGTARRVLSRGSQVYFDSFYACTKLGDVYVDGIDSAFTQVGQYAHR